jgi:acetyl esterase/lipase
MLRLAFPFACLLLAGCSPLAAFDAVVAKDEGSRLVAKDQPFADGERGRLDIYAPRAAAAGAALPVIVWIYGGSWNSGSKDGYGFAGRALAARGFVVVLPDYRLVPEVRFPAFLEDNAAAVRWVRGNIARFGGDPDRLVLAGHSAGAYNAAMLSLDERWLGEDRRAVKGFAGLAGPYDFLPLDIDVTRAAFSGVPDLATTQPVNFVGAGDPPALLVAGGRDKLVRPDNSRRLAGLLAEQGVQAESRIYPGLGHVGVMTALAKPLRGKAPVLDDVAGFARRVTAR